MNNTNTTLLTKLQEAIMDGYYHHFFLEEGILSSPFITQTFHIALVEKTVFSCPVTKANLYTIVTHNGYRGILILAWANIFTEQF